MFEFLLGLSNGLVPQLMLLEFYIIGFQSVHYCPLVGVLRIQMILDVYGNGKNNGDIVRKAAESVGGTSVSLLL